MWEVFGGGSRGGGGGGGQVRSKAIASSACIKEHLLVPYHKDPSSRQVQNITVVLYYVTISGDIAVVG